MAFRLGRSQTEDRMPRDGYRAIGLIERPRGLNGELKALPLTDFPERFEPGARVFIASQSRTVARANWQKGRVYLYIDGVADRETAETMRGELIEIPDDERPRAPANRSGTSTKSRVSSVVTIAGDELGRVREVLRTGANDVYIVDRGRPPRSAGARPARCRARHRPRSRNHDRRSPRRTPTRR